MHKYMSLTKRNCLVFLRDRAAVFFSLLSMLIVLMLMGVFLGNMNVESITEILLAYGGERNALMDKENATHLVQYWTLAGLMVVNALTVTLTVIGVMINDKHENKMESFYCAPVSKSVIDFAYISAAIIIGGMFCMLTLFISLIYISVTGGSLLSLGALLQIICYTIMNVCIFAIILYLAASSVNSSSAWSGFATVVGTLVGFVGAIYLPMGNLPESVADILKYIPILHGTSLMRKVCCEDILNVTFDGLPNQVIDEYKEFMGITVVMRDQVVSSAFSIFFMTGCGVAALLAIAVIARKRNISVR